jgi:hypothetical protein
VYFRLEWGVEMSKPKGKDWKLAGKFGVDTAMCWIGDPCYFLQEGDDWNDYSDTLEDSSEDGFPICRSYNFATMNGKGSEGVGVMLSTGWGDGEYPVYVKVVDKGDQGKRIMAAYIDFSGASL